MLTLVVLAFAVSAVLYSSTRNGAALTSATASAGIDSNELLTTEAQKARDYPIDEHQSMDSRVERPFTKPNEITTERFAALLKSKQDWRRSYSDEDQNRLRTWSISKMLAAALDGNSFLARQLSLLQQSCENAPRTVADLDAQINHYQQTRVDGSIDLTSTGLTEAEWTQSRIQTMQSNFAQCTEFRTAIAESGDTDLLQLAADGGYAIALFDMGMQSLGTNQDSAYEYFEQAWLSGYPDALRRMSEIEQVRYEIGESDRGSIEATAMFIAFVTVYEQLIAQTGLDPSNSPVPGLHDQADQMIDSLLPHQRHAMYERAGDIIEQNARCCITL